MDTVISYFGSAAWPIRAHVAARVVGEVPVAEGKDAFSPDKNVSVVRLTRAARWMW